MEVILILVLILANGFFAMAEMAVISSDKLKLKHWAQKGSAGARSAIDLAESPNRFLSTVQFGITLIGILAGAFGGATVADRLAAWLQQIPNLEPYARQIALGIVVAGITLTSLIFGEILPKRLALAYPERIAARVAPSMQRLSTLVAPFVILIGWVTEAFLKLLRVPQHGTLSMNDEEIRVLVEQGSHAGIFHQAEIELVSRVMRLDERKVEDLMTPHSSIAWIDLDDDLDQIRLHLTQGRHSYYPVYRTHRDNLVGIVAIKDLFAVLLTTPTAPISIQAHLHAALLVPKKMSATKLLETFRSTGKHIAVVVDEYGGIVGLTSFLDVMGAIVGSSAKEDREQEERVQLLPDGSWLVDGMADMDDFAVRLDPILATSLRSDQYHTLGGLIAARLGRLPHDGDRIRISHYEIEVTQMDGHRVDKVHIRNQPPSEGS